MESPGSFSLIKLSHIYIFVYSIFECLDKSRAVLASFFCVMFGVVSQISKLNILVDARRERVVEELLKNKRRKQFTVNTHKCLYLSLKKLDIY